MKRLLLLPLLSICTLNAVDDMQGHKAAFREHIIYAKAVQDSIKDLLFDSTMTLEQKDHAITAITKIKNQICKDKKVADSLLLIKCVNELCNIELHCEQLKQALINYTQQNDLQAIPPLCL